MANFQQKQPSSRVFDGATQTQTIAYTNASVAATNAFKAQTYQIRLFADSACNYQIGDGAQTATAGSPFLPANFQEYVTVSPGQKIAAIAATTNGLVTQTNGTLWVTEVS
jgi:hypothetical protein